MLCLQFVRFIVNSLYSSDPRSLFVQGRVVPKVKGQTCYQGFPGIDFTWGCNGALFFFL